MSDETPQEDAILEAEPVLEGEIVLAEARGLDTAAGSRLPATLQRPAVQTAAAAATGFLAGAATLALLRRGDARRLTRQARDLAELRDRIAGPARPDAMPALMPGRTYLVQFRVLSAPPHAAPRRPE